MHEAKAKDVDELRFFAEDVSLKNTKIYHLLTAKALEQLIAYNTQHGIPNHYYELMASSDCRYHNEDKIGCTNMLKKFGCRLYLDVEFPTGADFTDYNVSQMNPLHVGANIAKDIHTFLEQRLTCKCNIIVLKSHRSTKYSWHMICKTFIDDTEYLFKDSLAVLHMMNLWFENTNLQKYNYYEDDIEKNAIDISVYSTHKCYRTIHSSKFQKRIPLVFATYYPIIKHAIPPSFEDTLCMQLLKERKLHDIEPIESSTKLRSHCQKKRGRQRQQSSSKGGVKKIHIENKYNRAAEMFFSNWDMWQDMKHFIHQKWPLAEFQKCSYKTIELIYLPLDRVFDCPRKRGSGPNGAHKSNHSCLWIKPKLGLVDWRCHDLQCQRENVHKTIPFPYDLQNKLKSIYTHRFPVTL